MYSVAKTHQLFQSQQLNNTTTTHQTSQIINIKMKTTFLILASVALALADPIPPSSYYGGDRNLGFGKKDFDHGKKDFDHGKKDFGYGKKDVGYGHGKKDFGYGKNDFGYGKNDFGYGKKDIDYGKKYRRGQVYQFSLPSFLPPRLHASV